MTNGKQRTGTLKLQQGERVRLVADGCLSNGGRARWRMGEWTCTDRRLVFCQTGRLVWQLPIEGIVSLHDEDRPFAFGKKHALAVSYSIDGVERTVWIVGEGLKGHLMSRQIVSLHPVSEENISCIAERLSPQGEQILWHLWGGIHANIHEIADKLGLIEHAQILKIIREEINKAAREMFGYPLLTFEHGRLDPLSGKEVLFSWWLAGSKYRDIIVDDYCERFDEGTFYRIVAELRDVMETEVVTALEDEAIILRKKDTNRIIHEVDLPPEAGASFEVKGVHNGMMEIIVPKGGVSQHSPNGIGG